MVIVYLIVGSGVSVVPTFTTIELNGPVYAGEYGSAAPVRAKHLPQASPAPRPGTEPKASWLMAAVNPVAVTPQADHESSGWNSEMRRGVRRMMRGVRR